MYPVFFAIPIIGTSVESNRYTLSPFLSLKSSFPHLRSRFFTDSQVLDAGMFLKVACYGRRIPVFNWRLIVIAWQKVSRKKP